MASSSMGYFRATRHPWPCLWFLLPLLLLYEGGVAWLGGTDHDHYRTGADAWLRQGLQSADLPPLYWPPAGVVAIFILWNWRRRHDRPDDLVGTCLGMFLESVLFALLLLGIGRVSLPWQLLAQTAPPSLFDRTALAVSYVGAGIYEELLFRLVLYSVLVSLFTWLDTSEVLGVALAMAGSALFFAAAHHLGPTGEPFRERVFLFRTAAGLFFALLFQLRGFGITVGAHAFYDLIAGLGLV